MFCCPSDGANDVFNQYMVPTPVPNPNYAYAGGNYVVCTGSGTGTTYDIRFATDGLFYYGAAKGFQEISDGTSNTLMMSESLLGSGHDTTGPTPEDATRQAGWPAAYGSFNSSGPGFPGVSNPDLASVAAGCTSWQGNPCSAWINGRPLFSAMSTYLPPNSPIPDIAGKQHMGFFAARSNHPGGVDILLADGSVRFVADGHRFGRLASVEHNRRWRDTESVLSGAGGWSLPEPPRSRGTSPP